MILLLTFFIWLAILFVASSIRTSFRQVSDVRNTHREKNAIKTNIKRISIYRKYIDPCLSLSDIYPYSSPHTRDTQKGVHRGQVVGKMVWKIIEFFIWLMKQLFFLLFLLFHVFFYVPFSCRLAMCCFCSWSMFFFHQSPLCGYINRYFVLVCV